MTASPKRPPTGPTSTPSTSTTTSTLSPIAFEYSPTLRLTSAASFSTSTSLSTNKSIYSLPPLKPESLRCLKNLSAHKSQTARFPELHSRSVKSPESAQSHNISASKGNVHHQHTYPLSRLAAVLVALFVGRRGDLYVLLSRRSDKLHSYPGDTSLPGGKYEVGDRSIEDTARREAFEEIGLSLDKRKVPLLCILEPFLARNQLIVYPVVVLILDRTFRPVLNSLEVHSLFSHPLLSFLQTTSPRAKSLATNPGQQPETAEGSRADSYEQESDADVEEYYTYTDVLWKPQPERRIRLHRFLTGRESIGVKPIFGLTAAILIKTASIGYAQLPEFEVEAFNQPTMDERIEYALQNETKFLEALEEEERRSLSARDKDGGSKWVPMRRSLGRRIWKGLGRWAGYERAKM